MERLISRAKKYPIRPFPLRRIDCAKKGYIMDDARNRIATSNCMGILRCKHTTFVQTKRINPKDFNNLLRWGPKHLSDTQMRFEHTISSTPSSSRPQSTNKSMIHHYQDMDLLRFEQKTTVLTRKSHLGSIHDCFESHLGFKYIKQTHLHFVIFSNQRNDILNHA